MKLTNGMILAAGFGKRMMPITSKIPKPLIKIGQTTLLENCILRLKDFGIEEIVINTHYLSSKIENYINNKNFNLNINIFKEKNILDTGCGILNATKKFNNDPFIVLNPDTIWNTKHVKEFESLAKIYFDKKISTLLLVNKNKSYDKNFKGDFNINEKGDISRDKFSQMIYTGAQVLDRTIFKDLSIKPFSMNKIWDELIIRNSLVGFESVQEFLHINSRKIYHKLINEKFIY